MANIAPKTMLADYERLQSDTKVKLRMVFMYMIQLKVGQILVLFSLSRSVYAVNRDEPRRLTGINRDATGEIFGIQGRTGFTGELAHLY